MDFKTLGNCIDKATVFKGSRKKSFLAPRCVFVSSNKLFVSDTAQNRVFIWNSIPNTKYAEPDIILGQTTAESSQRNSGGLVSNSSLLYPSGIWSDGKKLVVADSWNHRVLIWLEFPANNGQPADIVLGQPNFSTNQPNITGQAANPNSNSLHWPYGVWSDGSNLWIADTGNRRVLYFKNFPTANSTHADGVIGKPNMFSRDYENRDPVWPYSVKVNHKNQMIVADTQFYRVLVWNDWKTAFNQPADVIIGQNTFDDCGQNQFSLAPTQKSLSWTYDACFYKDGILVNDTGNSRILWFDKVPTANNQTAKAVIGRPDFTTGSDYSQNTNEVKNAIYWPFSIQTSANRLFIADTGNHRIVIGDLTI